MMLALLPAILAQPLHSASPAQRIDTIASPLHAIPLAEGSRAIIPAGLPVEPTVERMGKGTPELDRRLDQLLRTGEYLLITRDTLIAADDTIPGTVLLLQATMIVEGTVLGDLVEVGANLFLRPSARIDGDLVNIAGGLYPSALAQVGGQVIDEPLAPYRVTRKGSTWLIEGVRKERHIVLDGFMGLHPPTYERVNALGLRWGAAYISTPDTIAQTRLHAWAGYMSGRGALEGGSELSRRRAGTVLAVGASDETMTNDRWIRSDLRNSLSFLWDGDDYRNYYLARRAYLRLGHDFGGERRGLAIALRGQVEDDRSLHTTPAWTLFGGDDARPNPPIDEGTITGLTAGLDGRWVGQKFALTGAAGIETAGHTLGGDFAFNSFRLLGALGMDALANHALLIRWYFQGPFLGTGSLPRQRWSILGGSGTLPAYDIGQFNGDRVAFVESRYIIPLPERWELPILGSPDLELAHAIGNAWTEGMDASLIQNLEARIRFTLIYGYIATDPLHPSDQFRVGAGLSWYFGERYPWRR
jgi:hypothetical protein